MLIYHCRKKSRTSHRTSSTATQKERRHHQRSGMCNITITHQRQCHESVSWRAKWRQPENHFGLLHKCISPSSYDLTSLLRHLASNNNNTPITNKCCQSVKAKLYLSSFHPPSLLLSLKKTDSQHKRENLLAVVDTCMLESSDLWRWRGQRKVERTPALEVLGCSSPARCTKRLSPDSTDWWVVKCKMLLKFQRTTTTAAAANPQVINAEMENERATRKNINQ